VKDKMTLAVQKAVRALLDTTRSKDQTFSSAFEDMEDDIDSSSPLEASQGQLCERVVRSLDKWENSNSDDDSDSEDDEKENAARSNFLQTPAADSKATIRSIMGDGNQVSELPEILAHLMSHRVDTADVMPMTYDATANEEAMSLNVSAVTLTRPAMAAAELYAKLVSMPGALGSGLVEMQALGALAALLRRWRVECCGREAAATDNNDAAAAATVRKKNKSTAKRNQSARQVVVSGDSDNEDDKQPFKRSRQSRTRATDVKNSGIDSDSDDKQDNVFSQLVVEEEVSGTKLSPPQLLIMGLRIARQVCEIPLQREWQKSWSSEARETVMDAVTCVLATASALTAGRTTVNKSMVMSLASTVVNRASEALEGCIIEPRTTDNDQDNDEDDQDSNDSDTLTKRHETTVSMLRGLFPILTAKDVLPKGESGKQAACSTAAKVLENFVKEVTDDIKTNRNRWPRSMTTPARRMSVHAPRISTRGEDGEAVTPKTSRRKKRQSVGTGLKERRLQTPVTPKIKTPAPASVAGSSSAAYTGRPRPVLSAVLGVLQKLATAKGLETASIRHSTVQTLHRCVCHLPMTERSHFLKFLIQMCHSKVSVHRLVASELVGLILPEEWLWSEHAKDFMTLETPSSPESRRKSLSPLVMRSSEDMPVALFEALHGRLLDRVPAIRAATAFAFADIFRKLLDANLGDVATLSAMGLTEAISAETIMLADCLRKRASVDDKATVRRAAVGALAGLLLIGETVESVHLSITDGDIAIVCELCQDSSMLTRKAAADAVTLLLESYASVQDKSPFVLESLEKAWCKSVLPLALDSENSCNCKAVDLVDRVLFGPILAAERSGDTSSTQAAWNILAAVGDGSQGASRSEAGALRAVVAKKVTSPDTSKEFLKDLIKAVHRMIVHTLDDSIGNLFAPHVDSQRAGSWALFNAMMEHSKDLSEVTRVIKRSKIDLDFLGTSWEKMLAMSLSSDTPQRSAPALRASMRKCLQVLSKLASCADMSLAQRTANNLQQLLSEFSLPPDIIGSAIAALVATTISSHPDHDQKRHREACVAFICGIYRDCETEIASHVGSLMTDERVTPLLRAFFTVGELSMVGFSSDDDKSSGALTNRDLVQTNVVRGLYERPSSQLVELVQAFLPNFLPGSEGTPTPETLRAHAFITIGKLCLRDERLAKKCLNVLARELHENMSGGSPTVQSNALLVLGDLCVKYTNMVDRFLPVMAACMQSGITDMNNNVLDAPSSNGSALVRKHSVLLLSSLILQDYVKWRGLLFQRFLVASADEDEDVARLAGLVLCGPLITKQPKLFFNQFVESIFVLNRCIAHPVYQAAASLGDGGSGISVGFDGINLTGEVGRVRRLIMYQMMLSKMTDEEKIGVTARVTKEILGGALEGGSDLNTVCISSPDALLGSRSTAEYESALNVLSDAFAVLSSPQMRVGKSNREAGDPSDLEDPNMPNMSRRIIVAKGQLLSRISRKHLIEIILPILCSLKVVLQKSCSRLLKDLMSYLVDVFRMYKIEVKEFLANDLSLLQEIEYDARQFKKTQRIGTPGKDRSFLSTNADDE
jgi:condensin-2 complex subunit D3